MEAQKSSLEQELGALRSEIKRMAQEQVDAKSKEKELEAAQARLREAFNTVKADMVHLQSENSQRDSDWKHKETQWQTKEAEWQTKEKEWKQQETALKKLQEEAAKMPMSIIDTGAPAPLAAGPEAAKALTAIRQQMQEMQTLLAWLRPVKRTLGKAA
jgi:chromosome segregation ATPase